MMAGIKKNDSGHTVFCSNMYSLFVDGQVVYTAEGVLIQKENGENGNTGYLIFDKFLNINFLIVPDM